MNEHDSERIAGPARGRRHGASRSDSTTPTSWCSTRAASGRTPTTSSTGNLGHLKAVKQARPDLQIVVAGCLAQKDRELVRAAGPARRRRARHPQRPPGGDAPRRGARDAGPITEIFDAAVPTTHEAFPSALPVRREVAVRRVGHHPDRLRQHLCLLHRAGGAGPEISRPFDEIVAEVERWPPTASSRSRCSART